MSETKPHVLLTGANGFAGAHVVDSLLKNNYRAKYQQACHNGDLTFVAVADIQAPGALDGAAQEVLVDPAVNGTRNVIRSALKSTTLKKMTILGSVVSVVDMSKSARPGYTYTADDCNPITLEQAAQDGFSGYFGGKTLAERAAWDMWTEAKAKGEISWDLVTLCPSMIYGPPCHEVQKEKGVEGLNTTLKFFITGLQGQDPGFKPKVTTPFLPAWVDVRDVAEAHVRCLALPRGVTERLLLCGGVDYFEDGLTRLRARGQKGLGEEGALCDRAEHYGLDNSNAERVSKMEFTPFHKTVEDSWEEVKRLELV